MTRLSTLAAAGLMAAGGIASLQTLAHRRAPRVQDRTFSIVVELDDVVAVSVRAGLPLGELLPRLRAAGATRCTLPERTLRRLLDSGQLFQSLPRGPAAQPAPLGRWIYLSGAEPELVRAVAAELDERLPQLCARVLAGDPQTLSFAGDLSVAGGIGLGFDRAAAEAIRQAGLAVVPRPVSYDWHEPALIERTLAQAAAVGDGVVAFDGNLILGHEMHLAETLAALEAHDQTFAYFAESRHQRGDWFIAKRRMPNVVIAHQYTPAQMIPEDFHSLAHHWANLARERGVRMMFANFFRVVHATEPLECLKYLEHIRGAVEGEGLILECPLSCARATEGTIDPATRATQSRASPAPESTAARATQSPASSAPESAAVRTQESAPVRAPESAAVPERAPVRALGSAPALDTRSTALAALVPVGAGTLAATMLLGLNDTQSIALAGAGVAGSFVLAGRLDRAHDVLEQQYAPAYASKLLSLAAAASAPLAAVALAHTSEDALQALLLDGVLGVSAAAAVSALTSSDEYRLRVEEYKAFDLDLWLPLAAALVAFALPAGARHSATPRATAAGPALRRAGLGLAAAVGGWYATRRFAPDPLARIDLAPAMSHTHHLSAAMRRVGDMLLAVGPRPVRKWSGLAPFGLALAIAARRDGRRSLALAGTILSVAGHAAAISGFRRPERDPQVTARAAAGSWLAGSIVGVLAAHFLRALSAEGQPPIP